MTSKRYDGHGLFLFADKLDGMHLASGILEKRWI